MFKDLKCGRDGCQKLADGHFHTYEGHDYRWYPVIEKGKKGKFKIIYYGQTLVEQLYSAKMIDGYMQENENWLEDLQNAKKGS